MLFLGQGILAMSEWNALFSLAAWRRMGKFTGELNRNMPLGQFKEQWVFLLMYFSFRARCGQRSGLVRKWKAHSKPGRVLKSYFCWVIAKSLECQGDSALDNKEGRMQGSPWKSPTAAEAPLHQVSHTSHMKLFPQMLCKVGLCLHWPLKQPDAWAREESIQHLEAWAAAHRTSKRRPQEVKKMRTPSADPIYGTQKDLNSSPSCCDANPNGFKEKF